MSCTRCRRKAARRHSEQITSTSVGRKYSRNCTHGGPPLYQVQHLVPALNGFQSAVFQNQQKYSELESLALLLASPQNAALISPHIARVLVSEAVDCHARGHHIAYHWFCSAILICSAIGGSLQLYSGCKVPPSVNSIIDEAKHNFAAALWRWTSCDCLEAPSLAQPWADTKARSQQLAKAKKWDEAIASCQNVLAILMKAEEVEVVGMRSCLSSRAVLNLQAISGYGPLPVAPGTYPFSVLP